MDILKAFKLVDKNIEINIQGTYEDPLFQANQIGKILDIKNIHESLKDFTDEDKGIRFSVTPGGVQNVVFLTEIGLYKLLGRSKKPIASVFQKWIINVIKEIRINGIYKLKEENEVDKKLIKQQSELDKHKIFIRAFDKENVVYMCKFKDNLDGKMVIKVGSSQNIKERIQHMSNAYQSIEPLLLDVVKVDNHIKFETFLHNHDFFKLYYFPIENKEGKISKETYLVNEEECNEMIRIINLNRTLFDKNILELEKIKLERDELKLQQTDKIIEIKKIELEIIKNKTNEDLSNKVNELSEKIKVEKKPDEKLQYESDDDDIDLTKIYFSTKSKKDSIRTPFVYQYNPNDLCNPIKIYNSPSDVERSPELKHLEISPSPLRNSSKNNTIYKGYRWYFVKRNEIPPIIIPETVENKHKEPEIKFLAMIDITKTKILNVYPNQKEATKARLMKCNSFSRAIKEGTISSGHYWKYFEDCSKEMQDDYLKTNKLPEKYISKVSKPVEQICPKTKKVLKIYHSSREVIKEFQMSVMSLKKYSDSGEIHNGYIWKIIG